MIISRRLQEVASATIVQPSSVVALLRWSAPSTYEQWTVQRILFESVIPPQISYYGETGTIDGRVYLGGIVVAGAEAAAAAGLLVIDLPGGIDLYTGERLTGRVSLAASTAVVPAGTYAVTGTLFGTRTR